MFIDAQEYVAKALYEVGTNMTFLKIKVITTFT